MKHLLSILTTVISIFSISTLHSAEAPKTLKVKSGFKGYEMTVPFTDQTTVAQIKQVLHDSEGIPADHQRIIKFEGWAFGLPPTRLATTLEDNKTCGHYDLQNNESVTLYLRLPKSQAEIEAELKARREAVTGALLQPNLVTFDPLTIVFAYDTYNRD